MSDQVQTKKNKSSILVPVILGSVATILLLVFLVGLQGNQPVVVVKNPVSIGARLVEEDVEIKYIRAADRLPNALTKVEEAIGQVVSVQRMPGDQLTADMLGAQAMSAIAAGLQPDHRAVAVKVTRSSGLAGILRPGDYVTLIAVVDPQSEFATFSNSETFGLTPTPQAIGAEPTATPIGYGPIKPQSPFARVSATGLKVLLVPQTFRYQEVSTSGKSADSQGFVAAQSSMAGQEGSVVVLDVPVTPVEVDGINGLLKISLPELIALLDTNAKIFLALEPPENAASGSFPGVAVEQLVDLGVGK